MTCALLTCTVVPIASRQGGALSLASPEVRFVLDSETSDPTDVAMYQVCAFVCVYGQPRPMPMLADPRGYNWGQGLNLCWG
mmetsp:Transcript_53145/g.105667  ORF Transcript_53145/g.105667 Transcript_53145/m.105667 type:complete len:81 (+) Transcript_53145:344-586(+)